jgi:glycosyltransferase involved in cell wall biosynthesis
MKIAFLADPLDTQYAGIHVFCKELLNAIDQLDLDHDIYVIRPEAKAEFKNLKEVVIPIRKGVPAHHRARLFTAFPKYLKQNQFDIVIELAHFGPFGLPDSIKQVTYIHDLTPVTHKKFHGIASHKFHRLILPRILRKSHLVLCNSKQTQGDVNDFVPGIEEKVKIIQLGISDYFKPSFDASIIKKLKIKNPFLLHVGTLEPRKNIPLLIQTFTELRQAQPSSDLQLVLAGKRGWDFQEILDAKKSSPFGDSILLTDFVSKKELRVLYTHAECLVMPSYHEGFGLPVLEAMACGCPCLISGEGALKEVGGEAAIYFDIHNIKSLINQTQQLLINKEEQLKWREKALDHTKKYSWKNTAISFMRSVENLTSFS